MRKLKKFKRYDEGGAVGAGSGDPFSYTDFSNRARNLEPSKAAPIEERKPPKAKEAEKAEPVKAEKAAEPAKTGPVKAPPPSGRREIPSVAQQMKDREQGGPNERANYASYGKTSKPEYNSYLYGPDNLADGNEGVDSFTSTGNAKKAEEYRQSLMPVSKPKLKPPAPAAEKTPAPAAEKTPSAAKAPRAASPDEIPGTDVKTPYEGEKIDNTGLAGKQLAQSTLGATAVGRGLGAGIRGAMGLGRMFESGSKPTPKTEPTLTPSTSASSTTPRGGDPRAAANRRAAESETKEAPKETPIRVDPRAAANRRAAEAKEAPKEAPTRVDPRAAANRRAAESEGKETPKAEPKAEPKAKSTADDEVAQEAAKRAAASRPRVTPKRQEDSSKFGGGKGTPSKVKTRAEVKPTSKKLKNPVGEKEGPTVDKVLESKGLSAKKGGKIPAFKKGGFVSRGDGCAQRGKTKGRMV